ncbi:MAG: hypothetical protein PWP76_203 [Candidatus Diapherotrites archaeon]|nr:hypothetical protein [Candidatus Diapherotrites archaeon]MDN5366864.1 hypothetical protein [Candidatus Diapherotrites archaeon]
MPYHGYRVMYSIKWSGKKSAYIYQRFFRAIYGYTQVVVKGNGRRYVYYREGVLTKYPFIKEGKNMVVVPDNALQPLLNFLKTGQNPAHRFSFSANWPELVKYSMEETSVDDHPASMAVLEALGRIKVSLVGGPVSARDLLQRVDMLQPDELYALYYAVTPILQSNWVRALASTEPQLFERLRLLQSRV